ADDRSGTGQYQYKDTKNYLRLIAELRQAFDATPEKFGLSIAAPASFWYLRHFDITQMARYLDYIVYMTYDIHGTWDAHIKSLGPFAFPHNNQTEIEDAIALITRAGVPTNKILLGIGYYGRSFQLSDQSCTSSGCGFSGGADPGPCSGERGILGYFEIESILRAGDHSQIHRDDKALTNIMVYNEGRDWVGFDSPETIRLKLDRAYKLCLGGVIVWSIDQDSPFGAMDNAISGITLSSVKRAQRCFFLFDDFGEIRRNYRCPKDVKVILMCPDDPDSILKDTGCPHDPKDKGTGAGYIEAQEFKQINDKMKHDPHFGDVCPDFVDLGIEQGGKSRTQQIMETINLENTSAANPVDVSGPSSNTKLATLKYLDSIDEVRLATSQKITAVIKDYIETAKKRGRLNTNHEQMLDMWVTDLNNRYSVRSRVNNVERRVFDALTDKERARTTITPSAPVGNDVRPNIPDGKVLRNGKRTC
ncbi:hypothetical protein HK102_001702, partial [Quaeritorhiza haematococci]